MSSRKRQLDDDIDMTNNDEFISPTKLQTAPHQMNRTLDDQDMIHYEDPYGDDLIESSSDNDEMQSAGDSDDSNDLTPIDDDTSTTTTSGASSSSGGSSSSSSKQVWTPGSKLPPGHRLEHDPSVYEMLHNMHVEWPCLSFDFIHDKLGSHRNKFPHSLFMVAGSQATSVNHNRVYLMKCSDLHKTKRDHLDTLDDDGLSSSSDDDLDDDPILEHIAIKHKGAVNRVRSMPQRGNIVATWSELGQVTMYDFGTHLAHLDRSQVSGSSGKFHKPLQTFQGHKAEGFAMGFSKKITGYFASGDCNGGLHVWRPTPAGKWKVDSQSISSHKDSVEDIQWSPNESHLLASCSADRSIRLYDVRSGKTVRTIDNAHSQDVNVIHWNPLVNFLIASGSDDALYKLWDLRKLKKNTESKAFAQFEWHKHPITSIEWHPFDKSMIAVSDESQTTLWDISVIADDKDDIQQTQKAGIQVPPQLLFIHQGQQEVRELHWHPQIPGVLGTTAVDGFNIFKTINSYHQAHDK